MIIPFVLGAQAAEGRSDVEARERLEELAPEGVTIDTDDVANTGLAWLGVLAIVTIIHVGFAL